SPRARLCSMARRTSWSSLTTRPAYRGSAGGNGPKRLDIVLQMAAPKRGPAPVRQEELRLLDGPNLYFTRPAVKLTLALPWLMEALETDAVQAAVRAGLATNRSGRAATSVGVGAPGSDQRRRFVARMAAQA